MIDADRSRDRILIIDDDETTSRDLRRDLGLHGYHVVLVTSQFLERRIDFATYDILIFDVLMRWANGLGLIRLVAEMPSHPGIIIVSDAINEADRVVALELGADDYLAKPYRPRELLARIRALIRRRAMPSSDRHAPAIEPVAETGEIVPEMVRFRRWRFDRLARTLVHDTGGRETLSNTEYDILAALVSAPQRIFSREDLLAASHLGPGDARRLRAIDVHVSRLRRKLDIDGDEIVRTVRGRGYMFLSNVVPD